MRPRPRRPASARRGARRSRTGTPRRGRGNGDRPEAPLSWPGGVCAENTLYMFRGGQLWKQVDFVTKNNFYNVQYEPSILIPFTDKIEVKKIYQAIGCQAADVWAPSILGDVLPQTIDSQTNLQQQSKIYVQDFDKLELPNMYAAFNRDANTFADPNISLWEGSYLTGHYLLVKLRSSTTGANYLFEPFITYDIDPRNF